MITAVADRPPVVSHPASPWIPTLARIVERTKETSNTTTFRMEIVDQKLRAQFRFLPGQFNMLYVFGVGEAAISISSDPDDPSTISHTIRHVGSVTFAINGLAVGDTLGIRGPFGSNWPLEQCRGRDILLVTGGIGIAPLRSAIYQLLRHREDYGRLILLFGVRADQDMLYKTEVREWTQRKDFQVLTSVDYPDTDWIGPVGVVTSLLRRVRLDSRRTSVFVCGPRVMNRAAAHSFLSHHVPEEHIFVSLERNMQCGVGRCGHCQYGPKFVCKDGPVFSYADVWSLFGKGEV
ncbi:MAG: FAD/NAD(P)-binding protein [Planctomycetota bacterium]|jgi:NAD(P)H-flavin reductase